MSPRPPNGAQAPHVPTRHSRRIVTTLACIPAAQSLIAAAMQCSVTTLRKRYSHELAIGKCAMRARARHNATRREYYALEKARKPK